MAQHDMIIDNASGYVVRQDVNTALQALAGLSSGANAPTMTYAYQWWADTTAGVLRQRNAGNTGWVVRGSLADGVVVSRSSNAQLTTSDYGKTIVATGTWTQTFASASALGDGWYAAIRNAGAGVITLDPSGSEQIDGLTTITLGAGEACLIYSNGTALHTVGRAPLVQPSAATSGTAPAYTLELLPAPTLAAGLRVRVNFHAATTAAATLNVSGSGAKPLKQYSPAGAKVAANIALGQRADVEYDGTDWVIVDALPPAEYTPPDQATQSEMESGTETGLRSMSPANVKQAIDANGMTPAQLRSELNATGSAPIYACRAWVNFNGMGTVVAIRASGNVSSITDNGVGNYTINFIDALPDTNYAVLGQVRRKENSQTVHQLSMWASDTKSTTAVQVRSSDGNQGVLTDLPEINVSIFR